MKQYAICTKEAIHIKPSIRSLASAAVTGQQNAAQPYTYIFLTLDSDARLRLTNFPMYHFKMHDRDFTCLGLSVVHTSHYDRPIAMLMKTLCVI